jgi:hypothetical protein
MQPKPSKTAEINIKAVGKWVLPPCIISQMLAANTGLGLIRTKLAKQA